MKKPFQFFLRVRYCDCDSQNVVFNARYGDYVDVAVTEYFRILFGGFENILSRGFDMQVVRLATDWKSPARFDDVLSIAVETVYLGNASYRLKLTFQNRLTKRMIAVSEITYVLVDSTRYEKVTIPEDIRQQLKKGAPGEIVDHAGILKAAG